MDFFIGERVMIGGDVYSLTIAANYSKETSP